MAGPPPPPMGSGEGGLCRHWVAVWTHAPFPGPHGNPVLLFEGLQSVAEAVAPSSVSPALQQVLNFPNGLHQTLQLVCENALLPGAQAAQGLTSAIATFLLPARFHMGTLPADEKWPGPGPCTPSLSNPPHPFSL